MLQYYTNGCALRLCWQHTALALYHPTPSWTMHFYNQSKISTLYTIPTACNLYIYVSFCTLLCHANELLLPSLQNQMNCWKYICMTLDWNISWGENLFLTKQHCNYRSTWSHNMSISHFDLTIINFVYIFFCKGLNFQSWARKDISKFSLPGYTIVLDFFFYIFCSFCKYDIYWQICLLTILNMLQ